MNEKAEFPELNGTEKELRSIEVEMNLESTTAVLHGEVEHGIDDTQYDNLQGAEQAMDEAKSVSDPNKIGVDQQSSPGTESADLTPVDVVEAEESPAIESDLFGKMPMEIAVELGCVVIDATDVSALSVGDTLTLETGCPGQVKLLCSNQEIGRGELIDINGQLGVQIIHNWSRS